MPFVYKVLIKVRWKEVQRFYDTFSLFQAEVAKKAAETAFEECSDTARHEVSYSDILLC